MSPDVLEAPLARFLENLAQGGAGRRAYGELPSFFTTADKLTVYPDEVLSRSMSEVSNALWDESHENSVLHTREEWWRFVQSGFAAVLRKEHLEWDREFAVAALVSGLREHMTQVAHSHPEREFAFGCSLLDEPGKTLPHFAHALLETREAWLTRKLGDGAISSVTARRIQAAWAGGSVARRRPSLDAANERSVLRGIDKAKFVCTVRTRRFAAKAAEQRAVMAARLALLALSLIWARPVRALQGLNLAFDGLRRSRQVLAFSQGHVLETWSEEKDPHAPWAPAEAWEAAVAEYKETFEAANEAIGFVLLPPGEAQRPNLMLALSQAMLWFHKACREPLDLMAIVNCATALDALAMGKRATGIERLLCARLRLGVHDVCIGMLTVKQVVHEIYNLTRNQASHGREPPFGRDWSRLRAVSEALTRRVILECLEWSADHPTSDDPHRLRVADDAAHRAQPAVC